MRHPNRILTAAAAGVALLVIVTGVALAQGASEKFRSGDSVTIAAGETISHDLYAFAGTVQVDGTVDGDLVASGGLIDITGTVTGDVLAAGGRVNITGTVGGDTRIAGGTLSVGGAIAEDLLAAGGQLTVTSSGTVGEDLIAGTGQLTIDGAVTGDVLAQTGAYTKAGTVGGTEDVTINARDTQTGEPSEPDAATTATRQIIDGVRHFLVVVVVGALMIWFAPRPYAAMKTALRQRPLPAAGWGIVAILGYVALLDRRAHRDDPAGDRVRPARVLRPHRHRLPGRDRRDPRRQSRVRGRRRICRRRARRRGPCRPGDARRERQPMARAGRACGGRRGRRPPVLPAGPRAVGQAGRHPARARRCPHGMETTSGNGRRRRAGRIAQPPQAPPTPAT